MDALPSLSWPSALLGVAVGMLAQMAIGWALARRRIAAPAGPSIADRADDPLEAFLAAAPLGPAAAAPTAPAPHPSDRDQTPPAPPPGSHQPFAALHAESEALLARHRAYWRRRYAHARSRTAHRAAAPAAGPAAKALPAPSALAGWTPEALALAVQAEGKGVPPPALAAPHGAGPDDLGAIRGVGAANAAWLARHGIFHFWQIARLNAAEVAWLARSLPHFGGRVVRENWVAQAARLARDAGGRI